MQSQGPFDVSGLVTQAQRMRQQIVEAREQLTATEIVGQAGEGMVQVTVKGNGEVMAVSLNAEVVNPEGVEELQDMIVAALTDAHRQATDLTRSLLGGAPGTTGMPGS